MNLMNNIVVNNNKNGSNSARIDSRVDQKITTANNNIQSDQNNGNQSVRIEM